MISGNLSPIRDRKFGTLLSANTPSRSSKKKDVVRKCLYDDEAINEMDEKVSYYTVVFPLGPIGLHLEQGSKSPKVCVVQRVIEDGVASQSACILPGDFLNEVNGKEVVSYSQAIEELQGSAANRIVKFGRFAIPLSPPSFNGASRYGSDKFRDSVPGSIRRRLKGLHETHPPESPSSVPTCEVNNSVSSPVGRNHLSHSFTISAPRSRSLTPTNARRGRDDTPVRSITRTEDSSTLIFSVRSSSTPPADQSNRSTTSGERWFTASMMEDDAVLIDDSMMMVLPPIAGYSSTTIVQSDKRIQSPNTFPNEALVMTSEVKSPLTPSQTVPRTPVEHLKLRVNALEAELQQERDNTKILQQDRIALHQCKRELAILTESNKDSNRNSTELINSLKIGFQKNQENLKRQHVEEIMNLKARLQFQHDLETALLESSQALKAATKRNTLCERELEQTKLDKVELELSWKKIANDHEIKNSAFDKLQSSYHKSLHDLSVTEEEREALQSKVTDLMLKLEQEKERLTEMKALNERLTDQHRETNDSCDKRLSEDRAMAYFQLRELQSEIDLLRRHIKSTQSSASQQALVKHTLQDIRASRELPATKSSYQNDVNNLTAIVTDMAEKKHRLQERLTEAQEQVVAANDSYTRIETLCRELRDQVKAKNVELEVALSRMRDMERASQQLQTQILELQLSRDFSMHDSLDRATALITSKEQELEKIRSHLVKSQKERHILSGKLEEALKELHFSKDMALQLTKSKDNLIHREQLKTSNIEHELTAKLHESSLLYEAKLNDANTKTTELRQKLHALDSVNKTYSCKVEALAASKVSLAAKVDDLQYALKDTEEKLAIKTEEFSGSLSLLEVARAELNEKSMDLLSSQSDHKLSQEKLSLLRHQLSDIVNNASKGEKAHTETILSLQGELTSSYAKQNELEKLVHSLSRHAAESDARCAQARDQIEQAQVTTKLIHQTADDLRKNAQEQLEVADSKISQLKSTIRERDLSLSANRTLMIRLEDEVVSMKKQLSSSNQCYNNSLSELRATCSSLQAELMKRSEEVDCLSNELLHINSKQDEQQREVTISQRRLEERLSLSKKENNAMIKMYDDAVKSKEAELIVCKDDLSNSEAEVVRLSSALRLANEQSETFLQETEDIRRELNEKMQDMYVNEREKSEASNKKKEVESLLRESEARRTVYEERLCVVEEQLQAALVEREYFVQKMKKLTSLLQISEERVLSLQDDLLQNNSMCSSVDSSDADLRGLSKSELRSKCLELQNNASELRTQLGIAESRDSLRTKQLSKLQEDNACFSAELDKLVQSSASFERHLIDVRASKEEVMRADTLSRSKLRSAEDTIKGLELQLDDSTIQIKDLTEKLTNIEVSHLQLLGEHSLERDKLIAAAAELKEQLVTSEAQNQKIDDELYLRNKELHGSKIELKALRDKLEAQECQLSFAENQVKAVKQELDLRQVEKEGELKRYSLKMSSLDEEISALRLKVSELESQLSVKNTEINEKVKIETELRESLDKYRFELVEKDAIREETVSKLTKASSLVFSQKSTIASLEHRTLEAEKKFLSQSCLLASLQERIDNFELCSSDPQQDNLTKRLQELEVHSSILEKERDEGLLIVNSLQEELRQVRRSNDDLDKSYSAIQVKATSTKSALEKSQKSLKETRTSLEEAQVCKIRLENELESKRMESDRHKASVQLLNATITRLNSDLLLYKEAVAHAESRLAGFEETESEISRLQLEVNRKDAKLEHLSQVYLSQQQHISESQNLEEQLIAHIEDTICYVDDAFCLVSSQGFNKALIKLERKLELRGLNLAGFEYFSSLRIRNRGCVHHTILSILTYLEAKRGQLYDWKEKRARRVIQNLTTPQTKNRSFNLPDTPSLLECVNNVKRVLNEHMSPVKVRRPSRVDVEYCNKVVHELEHHIDSLMDNLRTTNDALKSKDQLSAELERHYEFERDRFQKQIKALSASLTERDDQLSCQVALKQKTETELEHVRSQLETLRQQKLQLQSSVTISSFDKDTEEDGTDTTLGILSSESQLTVSNENQRQIIRLLTRNADASRNTIIRLKQLQRRRSSAEPSLDCIAEGCETS